MSKLKIDNKIFIPISELNDTYEFWRGSRFRQYGIGLNVNSPEEDYYEYMLCEIPGNRDEMLLTCCEGYKSGCALAYVKTIEDKTKFKVDAKAIKYSMGEENIYFKKE